MGPFRMHAISSSTVALLASAGRALVLWDKLEVRVAGACRSSGRGVSDERALSLSFSRQQKIAQRTKEHLGDFDPVRGVPAREERFERVTALEGLRPIIDLGRDVLEDAERCVTAAVGRVE